MALCIKEGGTGCLALLLRPTCIIAFTISDAHYQNNSHTRLVTFALLNQKTPGTVNDVYRQLDTLTRSIGYGKQFIGFKDT